MKNENTTPAAASAGAAGTIDTPEFWAHLHQFPMSERAKADIVAHIDQHTAAAEERAYQRGRLAAIDDYRETIEQERAKLRAATAPVSAAEPKYELPPGWILYAVDRSLPHSFFVTIGRIDPAKPRSSTMFISGLGDTFDEALAVAVSEISVDVSHLGAPVGISQTIMLDLRKSWAVSAKGAFSVKEVPNGEPGVYVGDGISSAEFFGNFTDGDIAPGATAEPACHACAGEGWHKGPSPDGGWQASQCEQCKGSGKAPSDGKELPAFGLTRWTVECPRSWIDPQDCVEDADGEWVKYSDVAAMAMRQPDPAGEWVKRADLAPIQRSED